MALLGKLLKGRSTRGGGNRARNVKVRQLNKTQDQYDNEKKLQKMRRDNLKAIIADEAKMVAYNRHKLLTNWRNIMRIAKTEDLKNEIEIYCQNNARELDSKEAYLQMLDKNLDEADEQYQMALRNHLIHLDQLIALQDSRLFSLDSEFERDVSILEEEFNMEREDILRIQERQVREINSTIEMVNKDAADRLNKARAKFQTFREEVNHKNTEDDDQIKLILEAKQRRLNTDLEAFYQKYLNDTQNKDKDHAKFFKKNQQSSKEIDGLEHEIDRLKVKIEHKKLKIHQHTKESKKRNDALRKEKDNINKNYQELKEKMSKFRDDETKRLTELAMNSRNAVLTLKNNLGLGERILKTAELCRRLETEREKVLPFYDTSVEDEHIPEDLKKDFQEISAKDYAEYTYLNNFYKRYNKVQLDKIAIEKQKEQLNKENTILKTMLKQYLDGISLNDQVLNNVNPLIDVNYKLNVKHLPIERMNAPDTHIEASKVYNHYRLQNQ